MKKTYLAPKSEEITMQTESLMMDMSGGFEIDGGKNTGDNWSGKQGWDSDNWSAEEGEE